jgi:hypothetical protein
VPYVAPATSTLLAPTAPRLPLLHRLGDAEWSTRTRETRRPTPNRLITGCHNDATGKKPAASPTLSCSGEFSPPPPCPAGFSLTVDDSPTDRAPSRRPTNGRQPRHSRALARGDRTGRAQHALRHARLGHPRSTGKAPLMRGLLSLPGVTGRRAQRAVSVSQIQPMAPFFLIPSSLNNS